MLEVAAVLISVVSLIVAVLAFRRTGQYEHSEYKTRLQLANPDFSLTDGLSYSAVIENKGIKPIEIRGVAIARGPEDDPKKRIHDIVTGAFYLGARESKSVTYGRTLAEVERMREEAQPRECMFYLWIAYLTAEGDYVQVYRHLGGYSADGGRCETLFVSATLT